MKNVPSVIDGIEFSVNGNIRVSSIQIANKFEKDHKEVLRSIRNLDCPIGFAERNFTLGEYTDKNNQRRPHYLLTRDGMSFLAMGFTGAKAAVWKVDFIEAFNKMEAFIISEHERKKSDDEAKLECRPMAQALLNIRTEAGKNTKPFHYSNEHTLIYKIVLGATKKQWCEVHGIDSKERFRDHMPAPMIKAIADMQRVNTDLIELGMEYEDRKAKLDKLYTKRHLQACLEEINKIEE